TAVLSDIETLDAGGWDELLRGRDAVVWSAGAGGGNPQRTRAVDQDAAIASMEAAQRVGAERFVMVSYFGASLDHGVPESEPFHAYAEAKARADEHLRGTELAWTILAPPGSRSRSRRAGSTSTRPRPGRSPAATWPARSWPRSPSPAPPGGSWPSTTASR